MDSTPGLSLYQGALSSIGENPLQNQEEEEDLEEQRRRQEEIQNVLKDQLDEFNFDDSTINSSTHSSFHKDNPHNPDPLDEKYRNAGFDDQLKVLYEVRVREVHELTRQLESLQNEYKEFKDSVKKKTLLMEADHDRTKISFKESQELLVIKCEEVNNLQKRLTSSEESISNIEHGTRLLNEENEALKQVNKDLLEQLSMMKNGLTTDGIMERQLNEERLNKIHQLEHTLENALSQLERKDQEITNLEEKLVKKSKERDEVMSEKGGIINTLNENLEDAQKQSRELIEFVTTLSQENTNLKKKINDLQEATVYQKGLSDKTEIIKVLQKELEKSQTIQSKHLLAFEKLQKDYSELSKNSKLNETELQHFKCENQLMVENKTILENTIRDLQGQIHGCKEYVEQAKMCKAKNEILEKQLDSLQSVINAIESKATSEHSVQVSQLMSSFCEQNELQQEEYVKLKEQYALLKQSNQQLQNDVDCYKEEIANLNTKVQLQNEREDLIKNLQAKAEQFEAIILQKQAKSTINVGINTESCEVDDEVALIKAKHETALIENEIKIRLQMKEEFENKLKALNEKRDGECKNCSTLLKQLHEIDVTLKTKLEQIETMHKDDCANCIKLYVDLKNKDDTVNKYVEIVKGVKDAQREDRQAIVGLLESWQEKFHALETENSALEKKLQENQYYCVELSEKLKMRENSDDKLFKHLQRETENIFKEWNRQTDEGVKNLRLAQQQRMLESQHKIDRICRKTERRVQEIESIYKKSRQALEKARK